MIFISGNLMLTNLGLKVNIKEYITLGRPASQEGVERRAKTGMLTANRRGIIEPGAEGEHSSTVKPVNSYNNS
jgi:hypothetical protein